MIFRKTASSVFLFIFKIFATFYLLLFTFHFSFSQPFHLNSNKEQYNIFESNINKPSGNFHTAIQPYYEQQLQNYFTTDSSNEVSEIKRKLFFNDVLNIKKDSFSFIINPLFAFIPSYSFDKKNSSAETNIGLAIRSKFNSNFIFAANILYNFSSFNDYQNKKIKSLNVIPGQGYAHKSNSNYEYFNNSFYFAYSPSKYFVFETGMGKNFWGDGYRSMILSNNAFNYPYLKIETNVSKVKYVNLWANFKDIRNASSDWSSLTNKFGSFHFLSWNISKRFNLGLYEAIIWQYGDRTGIRGFEFNYANPIIFFRPVEFSLGSPDNSFMGFNFKYTLFKNITLYSQFLIDDMVTSEMTNDFKHFLRSKDTTFNYGSWLNKQGYQIGIKFFDLFKIKNLYLQTELNAAKPYTYSHRQVYLNFGHYNQSLAHPLGSNFIESFSIIRYNKKRFHCELKFMYALTGLDSAHTHFGANIYQSTFDSYIPAENNIPVKQYKNHIGQGIPTNIIYNEFKITYLINKRNNLRAEAGFVNRIQKTGFATNNDNFIFIGIRTSIFNGYNDY